MTLRPTSLGLQQYVRDVFLALLLLLIVLYFGTALLDSTELTAGKSAREGSPPARVRSGRSHYTTP